MGDAGPCACTTVKLSAATLERLRGQFSGCLCLACLVVEAGVEAGAAVDANAPGPTLDGAPAVSCR
jgi:Cysteine-rich CWC